MKTTYQMDDGELFIDFDLFDPDDGGGIEVNEICAGGINMVELVSKDFMKLIEEHCYIKADEIFAEAKADAAEARRDYLRDEGMAA